MCIMNHPLGYFIPRDLIWLGKLIDKKTNVIKLRFDRKKLPKEFRNTIITNDIITNALNGEQVGLRIDFIIFM